MHIPPFCRHPLSLHGCSRFFRHTQQSMLDLASEVLQYLFIKHFFILWCTFWNFIIYLSLIKIKNLPVVAWVCWVQVILCFNILEWHRGDVDAHTLISLKAFTCSTVNALGFILGLAAVASTISSCRSTFKHIFLTVHSRDQGSWATSSVFCACYIRANWCHFLGTTIAKSPIDRIRSAETLILGAVFARYRSSRALSTIQLAGLIIARRYSLLAAIASWPFILSFRQ